MDYLDQRSATARCEWGLACLDALAPADVVIVVDVLSFSTCVDVAVARGATIFPYPFKDASAHEFARARGAELAGRRGEAQYSLSPAAFIEAPHDLRCVLPSPNGATLALRAAATGTKVLAGCLRNATAVSAAARALGTTFNVCPAGERWPDGSQRFGVEDWLGAGAILRLLSGNKSPEAAAAIAAFEAVQDLEQTLAQCSSGRELIDLGFPGDIRIAAQLDVSACVPQLVDGDAFIGGV